MEVKSTIYKKRFHHTTINYSLKFYFFLMFFLFRSLKHVSRMEWEFQQWIESKSESRNSSIQCGIQNLIDEHNESKNAQEEIDASNKEELLEEWSKTETYQRLVSLQDYNSVGVVFGRLPETNYHNRVMVSLEKHYIVEKSSNIVEYWCWNSDKKRKYTTILCIKQKCFQAVDILPLVFEFAFEPKGYRYMHLSICRFDTLVSKFLKHKNIGNIL